MTPTPADRRRVLRHTIECAIGLDSTTRNGQTGALTATVWRVIEPALTQRDAQLDAVRGQIDAMAQTPSLHQWAEALRRALDVKRQPAEPEPDAEYEAIKARYLEAAARGGHRVTVLEPDPTADAHAVVQAVTREQLHDAIRTLARFDRKWWDDELRRYERIHRSGRFPR